MAKGLLVIAKGVRSSILYKLDGYVIESNSTFVKSKFVTASLEEVRDSPLVPTKITVMA